MVDFLHFLKNTSYPGRGILVGKDRVYYFIMGRSENSRNRVFVKTDDGIRTEAFDPAKLADPSLIIYHPVRTMGSDLVVTNGDQTDTICEHGDFRRGLMTREYEPDEPNWTPRISAIVHEDGSFEMSILKHNNGRCLREFFCYEGCDADKAYFISTYQGDGTPLPSFCGEPRAVIRTLKEQHLSGGRKPPAHLCGRADGGERPQPRRGLGRAQRGQQGVPLRKRERRSQVVQQEFRRLRRTI